MSMGVLRQPADWFSGRTYLGVLLLVYAVCGGLFGALMWRELAQVDVGIRAVARAKGAALFDLVELARDWNAQHGGVFVPVTDATQPNPFLKHPRRDRTTTDGVALTMINPAFMTRQIAEIAARKEGVQIHITSLNPIRPANAADTWETEALQSFNAGAKERLSLVTEGNAPVYRFMAPLLVKPPCMNCHSIQGYKVGDIRGGISVTMPASDMLNLREEQRRGVQLRYFLVCAVVVGLLHLLLSSARRFVAAIQRINHEQEETIETRTRDLAQANAGLAHEVEERKKHLHLIEQSEARYRAVVEHSSEGVFIADTVGILFVNKRLGEIVGRTAEELIGSDPLDFVDAAERPTVSQWVAAWRRGDAVGKRRRVRVRCGDKLVITDLRLTAIPGIAPEFPRVLGKLRDVSGEMRAEREAQIAAAVFDSAAEAIMVTDAAGHIVSVNPAFTAITGYTPREVEGRPVSLLKSGRHDAAFFGAMWQALIDKGAWQGEIWNRRKNGEVYIEWLSITRISGGDEQGGFVATFSDITKRKEAEELMEHKAHHDALTDLPNRTLFRDRLHAALALARRYQRQIGLLYIDLDRFKEVNDSLGHAAGDALLIEVGRRLAAVVRDSDTVARFGGDEFAVVLPEIVGTQEAEDVARRIVAELRRPFELREGSAAISASIGIAVFPDHGGEAETLQRRADRALYAVKQSGRDGFRLYDENLGSR